MSTKKTAKATPSLICEAPVEYTQERKFFGGHTKSVIPAYQVSRQKLLFFFRCFCQSGPVAAAAIDESCTVGLAWLWRVQRCHSRSPPPPARDAAL